MKKKVFTYILSVLLILTLAFIWGQSILDKSASGDESSAIFNFFKPVFDAVFGEGVITHGVFRKLAHGTEFLILGTEASLLLLNLNVFNLKNAELSLFSGFLVASIDETIQVLTSRGSSVVDVWIDFGGFFTATAIVYLISFLVKKYGKKKISARDN